MKNKTFFRYDAERWMAKFRFGIVLLLAGIAVIFPSSAFPQTPEIFPFNQEVTRVVTGGQKQRWQFSMNSAQYFQLILEKLGLDFHLVVTDPDQKIILEMDAGEVSIGELQFSVVAFTAEKSGNYSLEISASASPESGRYRMKSAVPRLATEADRQRLNAHQLWREGLKLRSQFKTEARQAAITKYEDALKILQQLADDPSAEALTFNTIATIWYDLTNATKVTEALNPALKIWQTLGRHREEGVTLSELGLINYVKNDSGKALEFYQLALEKHRAVKDIIFEGETLNRIGWNYNAKGERRKAMEFYLKALQLRREAGNWEGESVTLNDIGRAYAAQGDSLQALEAYQQALKLRPPEREPGGAANVLNRIGMVVTSIGDWQSASDTYNQALLLARKVNDRRNEAAIVNNIGAMFNQYGDQSRALQHYELALKLSRETGIRSGESTILNAMGVTYINLGEFQRAVEFLTQALELRRKLRDITGEAETLMNLGLAYQKLGDQQKALDYSRQSLEKYRSLGGRLEEALVLDNTANSYAVLGDTQKAIATFEQALGEHRKAKNIRREAQTLIRLGSLQSLQGNLEEARRLIAAGLTLGETLRNQNSNQDFRTAFQSLVSDRYKVYIEVLMAGQSEPNNIALALEASERARARSLLELLTESHTNIRQGIDPSLLEMEQSLQQRLNARAEIQSRLLGAKHTEEQAKTIALEISELASQLQETAAKIRLLSPRYAALLQPSPLSLKEIQQQVLDDDTLLLEYSLDKTQSYLWAVTNKTIHSLTLAGEPEIRAATQRWLDLLPKSKQRKYQREAELAAAELSRLILKPAGAYLGKKRLVIVADGALQYVPFGALPECGMGIADCGSLAAAPSGEIATTRIVPKSAIPIPKSPIPLIVNHEIISLPSASVMAVLRAELKGRKPAEKQLAIFSDPVFQITDPRVQLVKTGATIQPAEINSILASSNLTRAGTESGIASFERLSFTRVEADAITEFTTKPQQLKALDFAASRPAALNGQLDKYRIIHFATHALLNSQHPDLSGVVLSLVDENGKPQDGFLRLNDLYNLKLNADLVVLSACSTALGKDIKGEGLVGLTRGFMYAGAARVVASLWNVNDAATAELMKNFYRAMLIEKLTPAAALRSAQLAMSRDPRWSSPYYWSGFVLQGEWQ